MKKVVVATSITGGVVGSAQPAAAATQYLDVTGIGSGDYLIYVNDSNAYGDKLESGDSVTNYSSESKFDGYVGSNDTDRLYFDGEITGMYLQGDFKVVVDNPSINVYGDIKVEGDNNDYTISVTDYLSKTSNCESDDNVDGDTVNGHLDWSDTDTYESNGGIWYVRAWPDNSITINRNI